MRVPVEFYVFDQPNQISHMPEATWDTAFIKAQLKNMPCVGFVSVSETKRPDGLFRSVCHR